MKAIKLFTILAASLLLGVGASAQRKIQVAILLDNSGSMSGLLEQAKSQLWTIVNEMATAKADGKAPEIEIALYEYGDVIVQIVPLTKDLDKISQSLFALGIRGGDEYCGAVIKRSMDDLAWSNSNKDLKLIYICGNEPFNQGSIDYKKACKDVIAKGIVANTIFCGDYEEGVRTFWKDGADIAEGKYFNINHNQATVYIETPFDQQINQLNLELNKTYIAYGSMGEQKKANQTAQDNNAAGYSAANSAERAVSKSSAAYRNDDWDLVDASKKSDFKVESLKDEELPAELKGKSKEEIKKYVDDKAVERGKIQKEIQDLSAKRSEYISNEQKKLGQDNTLDAAMKKSLRENAEKIGFEFNP